MHASACTCACATELCRQRALLAREWQATPAETLSLNPTCARAWAMAECSCSWAASRASMCASRAFSASTTCRVNPTRCCDYAGYMHVLGLSHPQCWLLTAILSCSSPARDPSSKLPAE